MGQNNGTSKRSEKGLLTPDNCVVALIDHQPQMLFGTSNFPGHQPVERKEGVIARDPRGVGARSYRNSHMHPIRGGLNFNLELRWDGVPSLADALRMLKEQAARTPAPQWVRVVGGWTEFQFAERRMPTLDEKQNPQHNIRDQVRRVTYTLRRAASAA